MTTTRELVGRWIRERRDELEIPATRLAELTGVAYQTIVNTEAGRSEMKHRRSRLEDILEWRRGDLTRAYRDGEKPRLRDRNELEHLHPGFVSLLASTTEREQKVLMAVLQSLRQQYGS